MTLVFDYLCRSFGCILCNRRLGFSLVGSGLLARFSRRLGRHFVECAIKFFISTYDRDMTRRTLYFSDYPFLGSHSYHSVKLWFSAYAVFFSTILFLDVVIIPILGSNQYDHYHISYCILRSLDLCIMHYALCTSCPCVPWWFQPKSYALRELCIITLCIMKKSTVPACPQRYVTNRSVYRKGWTKALPRVRFHMMTTVNASTRYSP